MLHKLKLRLHDNACARVSFLIKLQALSLQLVKLETLAQLFSCEFCEISKNTFSYRTPPVAASGNSFKPCLFMENLNRWAIFGDFYHDNCSQTKYFATSTFTL